MEIEQRRREIENDPALADHERKAALKELDSKEKPKKGLFSTKKK